MSLLLFLFVSRESSTLHRGSLRPSHRAVNTRSPVIGPGTETEGLGIERELCGRRQLLVMDRARKGIAYGIDPGIGGVDTDQDDSRCRHRSATSMETAGITQNDTSGRSDTRHRIQRRIVDQLTEHILLGITAGGRDGRKDMAELAPDLRSFHIGERPHGLVDIGQKHKQLEQSFILMIAMPELCGNGRLPFARECYARHRCS